MPDKTLIINALLFQIAWLLGVVVGGWWVLLAFIPLLMHFVHTCDNARLDIAVVAAVMVPGVLIDCLLAAADIYHFFSADLVLGIPGWLWLLWCGFGLTINRSLRWAFSGVWLFPVLCLVSGPFSYFAGRRLGAVEFEFSALYWMLPQWLCIAGLVTVLMARTQSLPFRPPAFIRHLRGIAHS